MFKMILIILILLVIIWIFSAYPSILRSVPRSPKHPKVDQIDKGLHQICQDAGVNATFEIRPTDGTSHVDLSANPPIISLVIQKTPDTTFDDNTLYCVAVHELTHILCPETGHPPLFDAIEQYLIELAYKRGLVRSNRAGKDRRREVDPTYPCLDHD